MPEPLVSVVITTRNEEKNIENCVKSVQLQSYSQVEVIVVDNGSEDRTREIAAELGARVYEKGPERSAQRNFGMIDKSRGKYVMFVDADMILSPGLIASCVKLMETVDSEVVALHIPEIVLGRGYWSRVRRFERSFYDGTVIDGARFFKKELFKKAGGFDESMSGPEDWDIDKKMKAMGRIALVGKLKAPVDSPSAWLERFEDFLKERGVNPLKFDNVIFHNEADFNVKQYIKKKRYYAGSFDTYITKWGEKDPDIRKQLGFGYRFLGVFLEKGKWLKLLIHPFLSFGMYWLRFLVGLQFMKRKNKKDEDVYSANR